MIIKPLGFHNPGIFNIGKYDTDYQAVLNKSSELGYAAPSAACKKLGNQLVLDLKSAGVWTTMDYLLVMATDGDQDFALLNWKSPANFQAQRVNTVIFTPKRGYKGDNVSGYINTTVNPVSNAPHYTLNNASRGAWVTTASAGGAIDGIAANNGANRMTNSSALGQRINMGSANLPANGNLGGTNFKAITRADASNITTITGSATTTQAAASTVILNNVQALLRSNVTYGQVELGLYFLGADITTTFDGIRQAFSNYMTGVLAL